MESYEEDVFSKLEETRSLLEESLNIDVFLKGKQIILSALQGERGLRFFCTHPILFTVGQVSFKDSYLE